MPPRRRPQLADASPQRPVVPLESLTGALDERIEVHSRPAAVQTLDPKQMQLAGGSPVSPGAASGGGGLGSFKLRPSGGPRGSVKALRPPPLGPSWAPPTAVGPLPDAKRLELTLGGKTFSFGVPGSQAQQRPVKMKPMRTSSSADKKCVVM